MAPGESLNAAFENSERGLGNTDYFDLHYKIIALSITTISVLAGVARKHNIMFPEATIIMRTVFCAMLIWTIHAIRLINITSLTNGFETEIPTKFIHSDIGLGLIMRDPKTGLDGGKWDFIIVGVSVHGISCRP